LTSLQRQPPHDGAALHGVRGLTAVLSIGKLGRGQASYYLDQVAARPEQYYTGAGEAPGRWAGSAAAALGLRGEVDADALHRASRANTRVRGSGCRSASRARPGST
jgi:hypothetical protein